MDHMEDITPLEQGVVDETAATAKLVAPRPAYRH